MKWSIINRHALVGKALLAGFLPLLISSELSAQDKPIEQRVERLEKQVADLKAEIARLRVTMANDRLWAKIEGIWYQQSHKRSGDAVRMTEDVVWQLKPQHAYQWILSPEPPRWTLGKMEIDTTHDPVRVNFRYDRFGKGVRVVPAIIMLKDGRVHLALREGARCVPNPKNEYPERPRSFVSTKENGVSVFVLERKKRR